MSSSSLSDNYFIINYIIIHAEALSNEMQNSLQIKWKYFPIFPVLRSSLLASAS